jgi:hypothetical protein
MNVCDMKILQGSFGLTSSNYIAEQIKLGKWPNYAMICGLSQYTEELLSNNQPHLIGIAKEALCFRRAVSLVTNKAAFVIIDNPNSTIKEMAPYVLLAQAYDYNLEIISFDSNLECDSSWQRTIIKGN